MAEALEWLCNANEALIYLTYGSIPASRLTALKTALINAEKLNEWQALLDKAIDKRDKLLKAFEAMRKIGIEPNPDLKEILKDREKAVEDAWEPDETIPPINFSPPLKPIEKWVKEKTK